MIYPLIKIKNNIHIVKDDHKCECGFIYNPNPAIKKLILRKIKFRPTQTVTCKKCLSLFNQSD